MKALTRVWWLGGLLVWFGCSETEESPMPGMSAEEHAQMAGAAQVSEMESEDDMESDGPPGSMVHLSAQQERALGVVYTTVERDSLARTIRTVGQIRAPEPKEAQITPKIDGFVEQLFVDYTGQSVRRGEPLLALYSPALVAAQEELLTAKALARDVSPEAEEAWRNAQDMLEAARRRLAYWDITEEQIEALEQSGRTTKALTLVSPVTGIVLEKKVVQGQRVTPGMLLYRLADLREMWVEGDVFEQDLQFVEVGSQAHIEVAAYPGKHLMGRVSFVYPIVDEASRTNRVRVTVSNPGLRLKPGMYATIFFDARVGGDALTVPIDAVVITGERNIVFIRDQEGMLTPRQVVLGPRGGDRVQILEGLQEGDVIVASANFLVDAESRLAGGGGMAGMQHAGHGTTVNSGDSAQEHQHD